VAVEVEVECHNQKDDSQRKEENACAQSDEELKNKTISELRKKVAPCEGLICTLWVGYSINCRDPQMTCTHGSWKTSDLF
jgi:hypothetical protein